jgi:serine/threonine protein kinase
VRQHVLAIGMRVLLTALRDVSLSSRIQNNHIRDQQTRVVTSVEKLEPLALRKQWMNDLAQAITFLESLNLAHGDLRPENILLDRDRLKLSDFDCAAEIGADFEACMAPYGRLLNSNEADQGRRGSSGLLGPRTEQFALGSLYYLINYGFEVYGDRCLTEDPREHGPKVVALLQNMKFPELGGDPRINDIIDRCWHNKYSTIAELAAHTETLLTEGTNREGASTEAVSITQLYMAIGRAISGLWCSVADWVRQSTNGQTTNTDVVDGDSSDDVDQGHLEEDFSSKTAFCRDLEKHGLLHLLCSDEPEQLGFTFEWYRHSC